ncbi:hypothetical protein ACHAWU_004526 [Discostella pseudostelligera]|uniref:Uncharacterized protein n=1 Tax=Discostella pseudostelligera TaxID=259834 RepID=A0ABD3MSZ7_9STRA
MNASRNISILRRALPSNSSVNVGAGASSICGRHERSLHSISSTMDTRGENLLPSSPPPSSSSSQSRPFFVATSSPAMDTHLQLLESSSPCRNKPSAMAIHRLLSNIGAPTSLRNIECIIQDSDGKNSNVSSHGMTADEMIDLIARIRSI